jgi:large conductance mechanosensitive channel
MIRNRAIFEEFKKFIMRGNVVELAVGVIIGGAFGKIVTSLVNDIIMPLLSVIIGKINFSDLKYTIKPATEETAEVAFNCGSFIQSVVDFLIISLAIFMFIKFLSVFRKKQEAPEDPPEPPAPPRSEVLLEEIRNLLKEKAESE